MNETQDLIISDQWIVSQRGNKNSVDPAEDLMHGLLRKNVQLQGRLKILLSFS